MHQFIDLLITTWFGLINDWGYLGIFIFMAIESSIIPLPSEVIIPPAAYYASIGRFDMALVVIAGGAGSLFGSLLMYGASRVLGRPFLMRYGKYIFIKPDKVELGERFFLKYSTGGVFFSRLIPVIRHLISIPAGVARMNVPMFCLVTTAGATLWCAILAWFGKTVIGGNPAISDEIAHGKTALLMGALREKSLMFGIGAVVLLAVYVAMMQLVKPAEAKAAPKPTVKPAPPPRESERTETDTEPN